MRSRRCPPHNALALVVAAALSVPLAGQSPAGAQLLLETGEFHGDEVTAASGGGWLALLAYGSHDALEAVGIEVTTVRDGILDPDEGPFTGKKVTLDGAQAGTDPVLLVRGLPRLEPRPDVLRAEIDTASWPTSLWTVRRVQFVLGGQRYTLRVTPSDPAQPLTDRSEVLLDDGITTQLLHPMPRDPSDAAWELLWAGDLDGDGRLDLYMNLSHHDNMTHQMLFLSTAAGAGDLVGLVAEFTTTGC
jgi:hypothetical protein